MARRSAKTPNPRLIDPRNRVALPGAVLRALDVQAGDYVEFDVSADGGVRLHRLVIQRAPVERSLA